MSDSADDDSVPADPAPPAPRARRARHNAFTDAKKAAVLRGLKKTGCLADACRLARVAPGTVYRHQAADPDFAEHCRLALAMAATPLELTAWQRAVEGVEQEFACGGEVHVRRRYSDGLLRLLLQGAHPGKYGPRPGFTRKRLLKAERREIEREIRAEIKRKKEPPPNREKMIEQIMINLTAPIPGRDRARLAEGWTRTPDGEWVPPGYGPIPGWTPPAAPASGDGGADWPENGSAATLQENDPDPSTPGESA
jgi:hypothetical protein